MTLLAILVGFLYAAGIYMILRRSLFKLVLGVVLLTHAANLLLFSTGGLTLGQAPILQESATSTYSSPHAPPEGTVEDGRQTMSDPLPQALVLTAIVIGFGLLAFALTLFHRIYQALEIDDTEDLREVA